MKVLSTEWNSTQFLFIDKKTVTFVKESFDCQLCDRSFTSSAAVSQHVEGNTHQTCLKRKLTDPSVLLTERHKVMWFLVQKAEADMWDKNRITVTRNGKYFCCLCDVLLNSPYNVVEHAEGQRHEKQLDLKRKFAQLTSCDWEERKAAMWSLVYHFDDEDGDNIEEMQDGKFFCCACTKEMNSPKQVVSHIQGRIHQENTD